MKEGLALTNYKFLFGYRKGATDKAKIIPEQADVVRKIWICFEVTRQFVTFKNTWSKTTFLI